MFRHISQHSLRRGRFELGDRTLDAAALVPFFDDAGRTRAVMLLDGTSRRIVLADWTPELFERRWLRRHGLRLRFADVRDADASDAERLGELWHFDPWWLLDEQRYAGHEAVASLRTTNLCGYDRTVQRLWFDRTLGGVTYLATTAGSPDERTQKLIAAEARGRLAPRRPAMPPAEELHVIDIRRAGRDALTVPARARRDVQPRRLESGPSRAGWRLRPFWLPAERLRSQAGRP